MRIHSALTVTLTVGILLFANVTPCMAEGGDGGVEEAMHVEKVVNRMSRKFWRGIVNVTTGVGEIPRQMSLACDESGAGIGIPVGFLNGVLMTGVRVGVGAFETVTFVAPTTPDDNTPAELTYDPVLKPVFVWESE